MKEYTVKQPFMAYAGQFDTKSTLAIGIEQRALKTYQVYRCFIGKNKTDYYDITYEKAIELARHYGERNVLKTIKGHTTFILPIKDFTHGQIK